LAALAIAVVSKILSGTISLHGLLTAERRDGTQYFSLGRAQLLVFTVFVAANYVKHIVTDKSLTSLPDLPGPTVAVLGGSQLFYLAGKARALWFKASASTEN
jgi:hypothetical protein